MNTIYLDPVDMDATAGAIGEHAREVEAAIADLESACAVEVPAPLADWLVEELRDITVHTRLAELLYVVAALDTAFRAQQVQADQSLATSLPSLDSPPLDVSVVGGTGPAFTSDFRGPEISVVGGTGPAFTSDFHGPEVSVVGGTPDPTRTWLGGLATLHIPGIDVGPYNGLRDPGNHASAAALLELASLPASLNNTTLAPNGIVYSNGEYEDSSGRRGGGSAIYRDPDRPGEFRVRP